MSVKFVNKQAVCQSVVGGVDYVSPEVCQIRAFTVFNPTSASVVLSVGLNGKRFVDKTVTAGATEVVSALFNQQVGKSEKLEILGDGLNVWVSVVEIVE